MVFSSLIFLFIFLVFTLAVYYILPRVARNAFLLIVSLFFYAWGEPSYIVVMIVSIITNYTAGRLIAHYKSREKNAGAKITVAVLSVIDIGLLVFFKYTGFIFDNISSIFKISDPPLSFISPFQTGFCLIFRHLSPTFSQIVP